MIFPERNDSTNIFSICRQVKSAAIFILTFLGLKKSQEINLFYGLSRISKILILRFWHFDLAAESREYLFNRIVLK